MFQFPPAMIFDMDGTLVDNMPLHHQVWASYLSELGAAVDAQTFHTRAAGKTTPETLRLFLGEQVSEPDLLRYAEEKERRYRRLYQSEVRPLPGVVDFLRRARRAGVKLALATSAGRENIDFTLQMLGLEGVFQAIIGAEEVTRSKPDPQVFLLAAERLGAAPRDCLVFEDSVVGIQAARAAGMRVMAVLSALSEEEARALPGVVGVVRDYGALEDL